MERILLIDKDQAFLEKVIQQLEDVYHVDGAWDEETVFKYIDLWNYDVVILNYGFNGHEDFSFLQRIKGIEGEETSYILIDKKGSLELTQQVFENSISMVLSQPFNVKDMKKAISRAIKQQFFNKQKDMLEMQRDVLEVQKRELEKVRHLLHHDWSQFRAVFENMSEPVVILDPELNIVEMNKNANRLFGIEYGHKISKENSENILNNSYLEIAKQVLSDNESKYKKIYESDTKRVFQIVAFPILDEYEENILSVVEITRDITNIVQEEEQILLAEKMNTRINFATEVGHELNNFISGLELQLQVIESDLMTTDHAEVGDETMLREDMDILVSEIDKIKNYSDKLMEGRLQERDIKKIRIVEFLDSLIRYLQPQPIYSSIVFEKHWSATNLSILGDETQFHQIFVNLFKNAVEAMDEGKIGVYVQKGNEDVGGEELYVDIKIVDTGCGIPEKILDKLFNRQITTKQYGHGYGLIIVSKLVEQNNGTIDVRSELGEGTEFRLRFPIFKGEKTKKV